MIGGKEKGEGLSLDGKGKQNSRLNHQRGRRSRLVVTTHSQVDRTGFGRRRGTRWMGSEASCCLGITGTLLGERTGIYIIRLDYAVPLM